MIPMRARAKWKLWSIQNRLKGFKFGPIQRFRCCDHTTPVHYPWCVAASDGSEEQA